MHDRPERLPAALSSVVTAVATFVAFAAAFVVSIVWLSGGSESNRWEAAVTCLALASALTGIFAQRWASDVETRAKAAEALTVELRLNLEALSPATFPHVNRLAPLPIVYPRLATSALDTIVASGVLSTGTFSGSQDSLHKLRDFVHGLNHRFDLVEIASFIAIAESSRIIELDDRLQEPDGWVERARRLLADRLVQMEQVDIGSKVLRWLTIVASGSERGL